MTVSRCLGLLASRSWRSLICALLIGWGTEALGAEPSFQAAASSHQSGWAPGGAVDGDRFQANRGRAWKGDPRQTHWWWQVEFPALRQAGAILQVAGEHPYVFTNAPRTYVWQASRDGRTWEDLPETRVQSEARLFRLHRLRERVSARFMRLRIDQSDGDYPVLREVECYDSPTAKVDFPDWVVVVNTTHDRQLPGHGQEFIPLARACPGWEALQAQQVWLPTFQESFLAIEPRPLCGFLSGNFKDWCEVEREWWRGTQEVLRARNLPMWASCGGAQGLALLSEYGVDQSWDCPHCRDASRPKTPLYTHIGHTGKRPCGDYSACVFERGVFTVRQVKPDPVFATLPVDFQVMESHCGQIDWPPAGWELVVTAGPGAKTRSQCLRLKDRFIYAAQFHIEMAGTEAVSRTIMGNFLRLAKEWGGYHPPAKPVAARTDGRPVLFATLMASGPSSLDQAGRLRWWVYLLGALVGYLLGSIPTGYLLARARGLDIRVVGSGNIGATNVFRTLGKKAGVLVLAVDFAKGALACWWVVLLATLGLGAETFGRLESLATVAGVAAILGHNYTCWLHFKGGKGIATTAGVLLVLMPAALGVTVAAWGIVFAWSRYVSLASVVAAVVLPGSVWMTGGNGGLVLLASALGLLAIYKHRSNIRRLLAGTESRVGRSPAQAPADPKP